MNDKRAYYYPALAYAAMLLLLWVLSWFVGIFELLYSPGFDLEPLVSSRGVRWAVRNSLQSLNDVPWGTIILVTGIVGFLRGSGFKKVLSALVHSRGITKNQRRASVYAMIALACLLFLLLMAVMSPWNLLLGVGGGFAGSPLMQGWLLILFLCIFFVAVTYGVVYGNFRSAMDVICSLGDTFVLAVPGIIAVVPAAGIIACLEYTGIFAAFDMLPEDIAVFADIVYAIPFLYIILLRRIEKKDETGIDDIENS